MRKYIFLILLIISSNLVISQKLADFQQDFERFTINPDSCARLTSQSGSLIFIQEKAINTSARQVDIIYREFSAPLDMIIHDLNMHTQFGNDRFHLESTGMFEIYSLDGNDTLSLKKGKRMEVRMSISPETNISGIDAYKYKDDHWENTGAAIRKNAISDDTNLWGSSQIAAVNEQFRNDEVFSGGFGSFGDVDAQVVEKAFQTMGVNDFGLYNYDRIIEGVERIPLKPTFISKNRDLESIIYIVYDNINSVFYFPPHTWDTDFYLLGNLSYRMFTIAADGQVSTLKEPPNYDELRDGNHTFYLESKPRIPSSRNDLASLTGLMQ